MRHAAIANMHARSITIRVDPRCDRREPLELRTLPLCEFHVSLLLLLFSLGPTHPPLKSRSHSSRTLHLLRCPPAYMHVRTHTCTHLHTFIHKHPKPHLHVRSHACTCTCTLISAACMRAPQQRHPFDVHLPLAAGLQRCFPPLAAGLQRCFPPLAVGPCFPSLAVGPQRRQRCCPLAVCPKSFCPL